MIRHADPVVSVPELADELGRSTTHIRDQLRLLEREGVVTSKDVGARAVAWWHEERVAPPRLPPEEHPDQSDLETVEAREEAHSADLSEHPLDSVDFPQSKDRMDCVQAVQAARDFLRSDGPATMREIVTTVGGEHPIGYDVPEEIDGRYRGAWWRNVVKPGLEALPDVQKPTGGASEWRVDE